VLDPAFYWRTLNGGCIGAAESFMQGEWVCDHLTPLMRLFLRDLTLADSMEKGAARIATLARRVAHRLRPNTLLGSKRNIVAHYDLGNEFFSLWLDQSMAYSCGVFADSRTTLEDASIAKFDIICRKLQLRPKHRLLEIGCGWGGFAVYAAEHFGCDVTAITLSNEQLKYVQRLVEQRGLRERVTVELKDYRQVSGVFDRVVSIEMIEAVGHKNYGQFFRTISQLLGPKGLLLLQAITIADHRYKRALKDVDFIQKYIFPGSCIPSVAAIAQAVGKETDMKFVHLADFAEHYVLTLRAWLMVARSPLESALRGFPYHPR
jgi:cyclopropane-fatty-acyl-phospholipid synthase